MSKSSFSNIDFVQFGVLSAEEWSSFAVCQVSKHVSQSDHSKKRKPSLDNTDPLENTPYDSRMGVLEHGKLCQTCNHDLKRCPGHFGFIELPKGFAIYNFIYIDIITKILNVFCVKCARPILTKKKLNVDNIIDSDGNSKYGSRERLKIILEKSKRQVSCGHDDCSYENYLFSVKNINYSKEIVMENMDKSISEVFSADNCLNVFKRISNEDMFMIGFNNLLSPNVDFINLNQIRNKSHIHQIRPEAFIFTLLPVLPIITRPYVKRDGKISDDSITEKYNSILKIIENIKKIQSGNIKAVKTLKTLPELKNNLKNDIWAIITDKNQKNQKINTLVVKSLWNRIQGKSNRIQNNIAGKRCNFSARSVIIGGGIDIEMDELGVPRYIAEILTEPETINHMNYNYFQKLLRDGKINKITRDRRTFIMNSERIQNEILRIGDKVERQLRYGDDVPFNRQPTLRLESLCGFRCKIIEGFAFRLGLCWTSGFNADFDGDEMNLHLPRSDGAKIETRTILWAPNNIVSAQTNAAYNGIVQDGLVGAYYLTKKWKDGSQYMVTSEIFEYIMSNMTTIDEDRINNFLMRGKKYYPKYIKENDNGFYFDEIPGSLFFSIVFPDDFNFHLTNGDNKIDIVGGIISPYSTEPITKKIIGKGHASAVHILWKEYSPRRTLLFLSEIQRIVDFWLPTVGFSFGVSDCLVLDKKGVIKNELFKANGQIADILNNSLKIITDQSEEGQIFQVVTSAFNNTLKFVKNNMNKGDKNNLNVMTKSGAKGKNENLMSICAYVGQQNFHGQRIPLVLSGQTRTLPHYERYDQSAEARGFIATNYIEGIKPQSQFFHAMIGRDGMISTAVGTAPTGYIQKNISRKMEDYMACQDGTVRDSTGKIIQFMYGDDGMNAKFLYTSKNSDDVPFFINAKNIADRLNLRHEQSIEYPSNYSNNQDSNNSNNSSNLSNENLSDNENDENNEDLSDNENNSSNEDLSDNENDENDQDLSDNEDDEDVKDETLVSLDDSTIEFILGLLLPCNPDYMTRVSKVVKSNQDHILRNMLKKIKLYPSVISDFVTQIIKYFESSKIEKGEMVGLTSGSCTGEPTTQMSVVYETEIYYKVNGILKYGMIGELIDNLINTEGCKDLSFGGFKDSQLLLSENMKDKIEIPTVKDHGYVEWQEINEFSKHPCNGDLVKITTITGRTITTTASHSHLRRNKDGKIIPIKSSELVIGDRIPVCNKNIVGKYTLDTVLKTIENYLKKYGDFVFGTHQRLNNYIFLLIKLDIYSVIIENKIRIIRDDDNSICERLLEIYPQLEVDYKNINYKNMECEDMEVIDKHKIIMENLTKIPLLEEYLEERKVKHSKNINKRNIENYFEGTDEDTLNHLIKERHNHVVWDEIKNIEIIKDKNEYVYDFGVYNNNTFMVANGIFVHNTLDVFHLAGTKKKDVSSGVPRFQEILHVTKSDKQKKITGVIYFDDTYTLLKKMDAALLKLEGAINKVSTIKDTKKRDATEKKIMEQKKAVKRKALDILNDKMFQFTNLTIGALCNNINMRFIETDVTCSANFSPINIIKYKKYEKEWWVDLYFKLYKKKIVKPRYWVITLEVNRSVMIKYNLSLEHIVSIIQESAEENMLYCIPSPDCIGKIDIYINYDLHDTIVNQNKVIGKKMSKNKLSMNINNKHFFYCRDIFIPYITDIDNGSIKGIQKLNISYDERETKEWVIDVNYESESTKNMVTKFMKILGSDFVDSRRTIIDDIHTINSIFGIEAARRFLIEEIYRIICADGEQYINPRHFQLLADSMTYNGSLTAVSRNGISMVNGPISAIMFEKNVPNAFESCIYGKNDKMQSLASSIMFGELVKGGSGSIEVNETNKIEAKNVMSDELLLSKFE